MTRVFLHAWLLVALLNPLFPIIPNLRLTHGSGNGQQIYAGLFLAFFAFGLMSLVAGFMAKSVHPIIRPYALAASTAGMIMQYVVLMADIGKYDGAHWYEGALLPSNALALALTSTSTAIYLGLGLPSVGIISVTILVPIFWLQYANEKKT